MYIKDNTKNCFYLKWNRILSLIRKAKMKKKSKSGKSSHFSGMEIKMTNHIKNTQTYKKSVNLSTIPALKHAKTLFR